MPRGLVGFRMVVPVTQSIVLSGLTLYLDAGKTASYPGTGTLWTDISGNGNNGTLTGGVTYNSANSGSLVFNGSTGYVDLGYKPIINTATTFTLNVWFKTTTTNEQMFFSTIDPNLSKGWHVETLGGKILMQVYPSGTYVVSPKALSANTWNNIAVTYNNGSIIYYSNGVQDGTASYTFTPSSSTIYIGRWGRSPDYWFGGNIANVLFYNRVLSASEVLQNYNATLSRFYPVVSDSDAQTFIVNANITGTTEANAVNTLVTSLKSYGIWTKMKAIYPFVGGTASSHKFNLKDPRDDNAAYRLTFTAGWIHSSNGALPNGTSDYADTFLTPISVLTTNSTSLTYYSRTNIKGGIVGDFDFGLRDWVAPYIYFTLRGYSDYSGGRLNSSNPEATTPTTNSLGLFTFNRASSTTVNIYKNGLGTNISQSSTGLTGKKIIIGGGYGNNPGTTFYPGNKECAFASIGDGLTDTEAANLYLAVQAYQTSLNRQV